MWTLEREVDRPIQNPFPWSTRRNEGPRKEVSCPSHTADLGIIKANTEHTWQELYRYSDTRSYSAEVAKRRSKEDVGFEPT